MSMNDQESPIALPPAPDLSPDLPSALERLGPSPFPKSGFPFLGFLATVYDHIAQHVGHVDQNDPKE
jgi:hypothetical protein